MTEEEKETIDSDVYTYEPYSTAEKISELLFAGKSLEEIAGYDDLMVAETVYRRRDSEGKLKRSNVPELPPWVKVDERGQRVIENPVPFIRMYYDVKAKKGMDKEKIDEAFDRYAVKHPKVKEIRYGRSN